LLLLLLPLLVKYFGAVLKWGC